MLFLLFKYFKSPIEWGINLVTNKFLDEIKKSDATVGLSQTLSTKIPDTINKAIAEGIKDSIGQLYPVLKKVLDGYLERLEKGSEPSRPSIVTESPIYFKNNLEQDFKKVVSILNLEYEKEQNSRNYEIIKSECDKIEKKYPDSEIPLLFWSVYYFIPKSMYKEAKTYLNNARMKNKDNAEVLYFLAVISGDRRNYEKVVEYISSAIEKDPEPPKYYLLLAYSKWYLWHYQGDRTNKTPIIEAIRHCEYARDNGTWTSKTERLFYQLQNSLLFYLCIMGEEEYLKKTAPITCFLEKQKSIKIFREQKAALWDTLGFFYQTIYTKSCKYVSDANQCENSNISKTGTQDREYLIKARDYYSDAINEKSLDLVEEPDGSFSGEDVDVAERYKTVLLMIERHQGD